MKFFAAGILAMMLAGLLGGCARTSHVTTGNSSMNPSQASATGLKPASQVSPCCRPLAEGRISLDQCMQNPACVANGRSCCMNAIQ